MQQQQIEQRNVAVMPHQLIDAIGNTIGNATADYTRATGKQSDECAVYIWSSWRCINSHIDDVQSSQNAALRSYVMNKSS